VVLLELSLEPVLALTTVISEEVGAASSTHEHVTGALALAWLPLCAAAATFGVARMFEARGVLGMAALGGVACWFLTYALAPGVLAPALPVPWPAWLLLALLPATVGAAMLGARLGRRRPAPDDAAAVPARRLAPRDVAVLIAAHDEEDSLPTCLAALAELVPRDHVFVGSDGSTDGTVELARAWGANVLDIQPNGGKAQALQRTIDHFAICDRFEVVLIADADARPDRHYLDHALGLFDDPEVVAVAGHAIPHWCRHWVPRWSMFFAAYRTRLYRVLQALLRYGQTWGRANVSYIIPGFSSMYRTRVLPHLDLAAPGLAVEDFNMTFAIHHHRLGRIAYTPRALSVSQEAYWFRDYWKQVTRWYLGFWQTVRRHGVWLGGFWLSLGVLILEMLVQSVVFVALPVILIWFASQAGEPLALGLPVMGELQIRAIDVAIGVFVADYAVTAIVAITDRKPILLFYGFGFVVLRWVDSFLFLFTLPRAFLTTSDGRWVSPRRI
jgi:poly-beta-1,6-N-acetyl-D-glucosamine synthase